MSYVTPPRKVRASATTRVADSYDARPANARSSARPYSGYQFARDVYGYDRPRKSRTRNAQPTLASRKAESRARIAEILATSKWSQHDYTQG